MSQARPVRLSMLGVITVSLFSVLLGRLWYLQILTTPDLTRVASVNRVRVVQEAPTRGRILDRNGLALATNKSSTVITIDRKEIKSKAVRTEIFGRIAAVLETDPAAVQNRADVFEQRYKDARYQELDALPLAEGVTDRQAIYLRERPEDFPGLDVREVTVRSYPYGNLAAHIIGFIGRISPSTKDQYLAADPPYQLSDLVGVSGVEAEFESELRGVPGEVVYEVDASNRVLRRISETPPIAGNDVVLTIDARTQQLAEEALKAELEYRRTQKPALSKAERDLGLEAADTFKAPGGAVVVEDATDGSVVAMASYPTFDVRELAAGVSKDRLAQLNCVKEQRDAGTCDPEEVPLFNRAIQGQYPPGSTFKLVTATAALSTGMMSSTDTVDDRGSFKLPNCDEGQKCIWFNAGHFPEGTLNISDAITKSSDVFFYTVGYRFVAEQTTWGFAMQDTASRYGFGQLTGIQLPSEQDGFIPSKEANKARHDASPKAFPQDGFFTGDYINLAVGQGDMLVTPLQLANAYSAFGNGGHLFSPNIVDKVTAPRSSDDSLGPVIRTMGTRELRTKLAMPDLVHRPILTGLEGVVGNGNGTARNTFQDFPLDKVPVAGKTGTAQTGARNRNVDDNSVFVAFAPADQPKYTVSVFMEKSGFGALASAPVARLMLEALFNTTSCVPAKLTPLPEFVPGQPASEPGPLPDNCHLFNPGEGVDE